MSELRACVTFAGVAIIGAVSVGDRAIVGANAVVMDDTPPDSVAIGVPARLRDNPTPILTASSA
jgi:serine O-acetyltransferase